MEQKSTYKFMGVRGFSQFDINESMDDKEVIEKAFERLELAQTLTEGKKEGLDKLLKKFKIIKEGDDIDRRYIITFNSDKEESIDDPICQDIKDNFIYEYGLDIYDVVREMSILKDQLESRILKDKPAYCEVDLLGMTDKKEPVEC